VVISTPSAQVFDLVQRLVEVSSKPPNDYVRLLELLILQGQFPLELAKVEQTSLRSDLSSRSRLCAPGNVAYGLKLYPVRKISLLGLQLTVLQFSLQSRFGGRQHLNLVECVFHFFRFRTTASENAPNIDSGAARYFLSTLESPAPVKA
jgi:hypothetical protein